MKKERLKLVSAMLLLSGFSTGYVQAASHAAAVEMHSVQQDNACTGVVVDQNGETVIGASVVVKGTTNGTITGLDGDFSIPNVKKGDVIVVSYVGYMNSEIIWEGKPLKIALKEDSKTLDEVVVVGYATVKKANLTGAVSAVDDKVLADRPIVNLGQGLQGTIPNLNITTSGQPGKGSSFNVRGETSINGGSDKATYYTSVGYMDQGSLMRYGDEGFRKFNMVNNINYDINNWMHVSMKTSYIRTELDGLAQDAVHGESWIGNDTQPLMPVKHPDGNWSGQGNYTNFAAVLDEMGSRKTTKNDFWNTLALKLTPLKGLTINMDYTFNYYAEHGKVHRKTFNEYGIDGKFLQVFQHSRPNGVSESQANDTYNAFNLFGDYELTLGKHYFKVMAGYNQETKHTRGFSASRDELISNDLPSMDAATGEKYVGNSDDSWATRSGFFRVNYSFADRYLLEVNGRYDLSSKFPKDDRSVFSPSFSLGWKLSEESWFKQATNGFFDELKIRASYGSLANQALDNGWYAYLSNYGTGTLGYIMGGKQPQYVLPGGLVSNTVTWEKVTQWDLGLDFVILQNRLKGTFDYYQRKTTDMLGPGRILPNILGMSEPLENAADMVTRGWELALTWNDQLDNGLHYSVGFNLSDTRAEITKYDNPTKSLSSPYYEGQIVGDIWGYESSLFQSADEIASAPDQSKLDGGISKVPGDIRFMDIDGNGVVDYGENTVDKPGDMKIIGNNKARYRYGFNISADWKGFDLGIFFQGVGKRDLMLPYTFKWQYGSMWQVPTAVGNDYWREDNAGGWLPVARFNGSQALGQNQTRYLLDASYLRLKSLSFGYTLPVSLTKQWGIQKCRVYFTGENLLTFKHTPEGFDPELDDPYKYPQQKSLALGLNVVF